MTAFKPARYFGVQMPSSGFGKIFGLVGFGIPVALEGTFAAAAGDGEVTFSCTAIPGAGEWGDALESGDAAGTNGKIQWWTELDGWTDLVTPAATGDHDFTVHGGLWGTEITVRVRAVSAEGISGRLLSGTVTTNGTAQVQTVTTDESGNVLTDADGNVVFTWETP